MARSLPFALLIALHLHAAVPIAPLEPIPGPVWNSDSDAVSATTGESTLTVWENYSSPYLEGFSVWARLLESDLDRGAFPLARGHRPRVASNGTDFFVTYVQTVSRFSSHFRPTVFARVIHADGSPGSLVYLHHSTQVYPVMNAVAWSGSTWLVAFSDPDPMIAVVGADLRDIRIVELEGSPVRDFVTVGGTTFAVRTTGDRTDAIEIRDDATIGATHSVAGANGRIVATSATAATAFFDSGVATFTADRGFGAPSPFANAPGIVDVLENNGRALLLHYDTARDVIGVTEFDGLIAGATTDVLAGVGPYHYARLGATHEGPVLHYSFTTDLSRQFQDDLYAYSLTPPRTYAVEEGTLISITNRATQGAPMLAWNGASVIAFWWQTIDANGNGAWFSRLLDRNGTPAGEVARLPATTFVSDAHAFDGTNLVMVGGHGTISAISISADGKTATAPVAIGNGRDPEIASGPNGTFAIWIDDANLIRGTLLQLDGTPYVPGGFPILPAVPGQQQQLAKTAAAGDDFLILWDDAGARSAVITASGTVSSFDQLTNVASREIVLAGAGRYALAAVLPDTGPTKLFAFRGTAKTFETFDPQWGNWIPREILAVEEERYVVIFERDGIQWSAEVTMSGAGIEAGTPRALGRFPQISSQAFFATTGEKVVVGYASGSRGMIATSPPPRPRPVRQ